MCVAYTNEAHRQPPNHTRAYQPGSIPSTSPTTGRNRTDAEPSGPGANTNATDCPDVVRTVTVSPAVDTDATTAADAGHDPAGTGRDGSPSARHTATSATWTGHTSNAAHTAP